MRITTGRKKLNCWLDSQPCSYYRWLTHTAQSRGSTIKDDHRLPNGIFTLKSVEKMCFVNASWSVAVMFGSIFECRSWSFKSKYKHLHGCMRHLVYEADSFNFRMHCCLWFRAQTSMNLQDASVKSKSQAATSVRNKPIWPINKMAHITMKYSFFLLWEERVCHYQWNNN